MALRIEYSRIEDSNRFRGIVWDGNEIKDIAEGSKLKWVVDHMNANFPGVPNNTGYKGHVAIEKRI